MFTSISPTQGKYWSIKADILRDLDDRVSIALKEGFYLYGPIVPVVTGDFKVSYIQVVVR